MGKGLSRYFIQGGGYPLKTFLPGDIFIHSEDFGTGDIQNPACGGNHLESDRFQGFKVKQIGSFHGLGPVLCQSRIARDLLVGEFNLKISIDSMA